MPSEYCIQCGGKNDYLGAKPNFCSKCGKPFNKAVASNEGFDDEEEEYESSRIPSRASLKGTVEANLSLFGKQNMGELIQMGAPREEYRPRPARESLEGKDLLKQVRQECASNRNNPIDIG